MKFKHNYYVPILKSKDGELAALSQISKITKKHMTPFIDVHRIPLRYPERIPKKSLPRHLRDIASKLRKSWSGNIPIFVDMYEINTSKLINKIHPFEYLFALLKANSVEAIPTVGLDRDNNYVSALSNITFQNDTDICIRLMDEDVVNTYELNKNLNDLLRRVGRSPRGTHLLIDLRSLEHEDIEKLRKRIIGIINHIEGIDEWKTFTLAASSYPSSLANVNTNSITRIERNDFKLWSRLVSGTQEIKRRPSFGDYGIVHPVQPEIDPRHMKPSAKIRYTLESEWLVIKGTGVERDLGGFSQYHNLATQLINRNEFKSAFYSEGDNIIAKCAKRDTGCGNLTTWIKVDTIHHLTFVSKQVSNFSAA